MNSRERVLTALDHRQPDRTPRGFWAESATWNRLLTHTGHESRDTLLDDLDIDLRILDVPGPMEQEIGGGTSEKYYRNFWGEQYIYRQTDWGFMREDIAGALNEASVFDDLKNFPWPSPDIFDYSTLAGQCRHHENRALLYGFADIWERPALVRGLQNMFLDMVERPDWVHFLARK